MACVKPTDEPIEQITTDHISSALSIEFLPAFYLYSPDAAGFRIIRHRIETLSVNFLTPVPSFGRRSPPKSGSQAVSLPRGRLS
jgi:hypothetical protein